jgi:CRP-like cAMP-binding protein/BarA-like signal transduction histidine kinase
MRKIVFVGVNTEDMPNIPDILGIAGYEVFHAEDGKAGVHLIMEHIPDMVISTIQLAYLDGLSLLHVVRKQLSLVCMPVIFVTSSDSRDEVRKVMTAGADDCITAPFTETELLYVVECRLKKADMMKTYIQQNSESNNVNGHSEKKVLEEFLEGRSLHRFGRNQNIYKEGQSPKFLYFIKNGKVRLVKSSSDGKDLVTDLCGEGDFLGHTALIQNTHYRESAESIDAAELVLVPRSEFQQLLKENLVLSYKFNQILASTLTHKNSHLVGIAYNSLRQKVAEALLLVKNKYADQQQENFAIQMNREVLANIAGTAKESLIRTLSDFKSERLIEVGTDGIIKIVNEKRLQVMAG